MAFIITKSHGDYLPVHLAGSFTPPDDPADVPTGQRDNSASQCAEFCKLALFRQPPNDQRIAPHLAMGRGDGRNNVAQKTRVVNDRHGQKLNSTWTQNFWMSVLAVAKDGAAASWPS